MKLAGVFFLAILPLMSFAADKCALSTNQRAEYLKLDYQKFDQSLPSGGWRGFAQSGCELAAANLIEEYKAKYLKTLEKWQIRVLTWHTGQLYAAVEMREQAIEKFKQSYDDNELPDSILNWNLYVDATIAFLKKDHKAVIKIRDQMVADKPQDPNLRLVQGFVRCPNATYNSASSNSCR